MHFPGLQDFLPSGVSGFINKMTSGTSTGVDSRSADSEDILVQETVTNDGVQNTKAPSQGSEIPPTEHDTNGIRREIAVGERAQASTPAPPDPKRRRRQGEPQPATSDKERRDAQILRQQYEKTKKELWREKEGKEELAREANGHINVLTLQKQALEEETRRLRADLAREMERHELTNSRLEARTREWHSAQTYLVSSDSLSASDVTKLTKQLNSEIYQLSNSIVDWFAEQGLEPRQNEMDLAEVTPFVGEELLTLLVKHTDLDASQTIYQVATAQALVFRCTQYLVLFSLNPEHNAYLSGLHAYIQATELPSVAGRWRAITRSKSKAHSDISEDQFVAILAQTVSAVLQVSTGVPGEDMAVLLTKRFSVRLRSFVKLVKKLDQVIGEGFTSQELFTITPQPGADFDSLQMEDEYEDPRQKRKQPTLISGRVVCTMGLGLGISTRSKIGDGQLEVHHKVLHRAKVVIESNTPWGENTEITE